jgi:hypothetical protein
MTLHDQGERHHARAANAAKEIGFLSVHVKPVASKLRLWNRL